MAHVTLKLSGKALDHLSTNAAEAESLSDSISSLLQVNGILNSAYSEAETYKASSNKVTLRFEDGATRTYSGLISPTNSGPDYEYGTAIANSLALNVPAGIKEAIQGELFYTYEADSYGNLWINYQSGTITDYRLDVLGKLADPLYGNLSVSFTGQLTASIAGNISGSISSLRTTAQKIEKNSLIEGDFFASGDAATGVEVSGTLHKLRTEFHDKSLIEVLDSRVVDSTAIFSLPTLRQQDYWSGDDIFNVELSNTATQTLRINTGDGNDNLTLKGGRGLLNVDAGNGDDMIRLLDSAPVIRGGAGDDTIETIFSYSIAGLEDIENLTLYGNKKANATGSALDNMLHGNSAANVLDGKSGSDLMIGGLGNDTYVVDNINDEAVELANQGIDTVNALISWSLGEYLEHLQLLGSANLQGTGNSAANKITGNIGDNALDGVGGVDALLGGGGNDTYIVDLAIKGLGSKAKLALEDKIIETTSHGIDTLQLRGEFDLTVATTLTLANNLENLNASQTGHTLLNLSGNAADNLIIGNAADNILIGGGGVDQLFGGEGSDTFRLTSLKDLGLGERQDMILDFTRGEDVIDFNPLKGYNFIGEQAFSGLKQLRYETDGSDLTLLGNANGDSQPEFSLKLVGVTSLSEADLLLA